MHPSNCDAKLVLVGGGSFAWTHRLVTDIACTPSLHGMHIVLCDIDEAALGIVHPLCEQISGSLGASLHIEESTDLAGSLIGADFVILTISTARDKGDWADLAIPSRYGVLQTSADTVGPGGWSRALRNIPVVVDIARTIEQVAPDAWLLNYSNPMTTLTRALRKACSVKTVGLCHELQGLLLHMAYYCGVDWERDIQVKMAGINHLIWVLEMDVCAQDGLCLFEQYHTDPEGFRPLGPQVVPSELEQTGGANPHQRIRLDLLRRTGALPAADDAHTAEFFSHYLTDIETARCWRVMANGKAHEQERLGRHESWRAHIEALLAGTQPLWLKHSHEHASRIMAALLGRAKPLITPVNTGNTGQVDNLPPDVVLETMAAVDSAGVHPVPVGRLPDVLVSHLMQHIPTQETIVEAGLTGNRELAELALSQDPLVPSPDIAKRIADDLFDELAQWLPQFNGAWSM
jgi:alpha-galactosidase/6-phospho-beta-glucosidase family protein